MSVDLPAPFSPQIAWISRSRTVIRTWSSAFTPGKVLVIDLISRTTGVSSIVPAPCAALHGRRRCRSVELGWDARTGAGFPSTSEGNRERRRDGIVTGRGSSGRYWGESGRGGRALGPGWGVAHNF